MRIKNVHFQIGLIISLQCGILAGQDKLIELDNHEHLSLQIGLNITDFQNTTADPRLGYTAGITYHYYFSDSFGLDFSALISRQNIYAKNRQTADISGASVHRIIYDTDVSLLYIELPLCLKFKIWENNSTYFYIGVGLGYSISIQDDSKNLNHIVTDEILDISAPVDAYYIEESVFENSGINLNAAAYMIRGKFILTLGYSNKAYAVKRIDETNSFILTFGYILP